MNIIEKQINKIMEIKYSWDWLCNSMRISQEWDLVGGNVVTFSKTFNWNVLLFMYQNFLRKINFI